MAEKDLNPLFDISDKEIEREQEQALESERQSPKAMEWKQWRLEDSQSFDKLITRAATIETSEPMQNMTIKNAIRIIFDSMAKQTLQHYLKNTKVSDSYYQIFIGSSRPSDFELLKDELSTANIYKESIERNAALKAYTPRELLEQGFDENGNFIDNSPFQQDFLQAFHSLQANAEYVATKKYIAMLQKVKQSLSDSDKAKKECPVIWEQLRKEWEQTKTRLFHEQCGLKEKPPDEEIKRLAVACVLANETKDYHNILHGKPTNALTHSSKTRSSKRKYTVDPFTDTGSLLTANGVQIFLRNFNNIRLNVQTHKVLDALTMKLTRSLPYGEATAEQIQKHRAVELSVNEYMNLCGLKDKEKAQKQLKEAILTLYSISLEWNEPCPTTSKGKKNRTDSGLHHSLRIADHTIADMSRDPIKNGKVIFKFTFDLVEYLNQAFIMPYPDKLLTINSKYNPHGFHIGRKLGEHHNMNIGKANANRISVKALLEALPDLPSYESIMSGNSRSVTQKIIKPFERDLIALKDEYDILASWYYCNSGGAPLTDEQVESYRYDDWIQWLIEFELKDYPDQSKRLEKPKRKRLPAKRTKTAQDN